MPSTVRPATLDDLDVLIDLLWAVAAEGRWIGTEVPFDRDARRRWFTETIGSPASTVLVAVVPSTDGDTVVGHIAVTVEPYGVADFGMLLADGHRGRGLGRALLDAAIEWATGAGAHKMWLEAWPDNAAALELYRSAGFVEEGRKIRHYRRRSGELWDSVLMGRPLP